MFRITTLLFSLFISFSSMAGESFWICRFDYYDTYTAVGEGSSKKEALTSLYNYCKADLSSGYETNRDAGSYCISQITAKKIVCTDVLN